MVSRIFLIISPLAFTGAVEALTYHCAEPVERGALTEVPIGRRTVIGVVTGYSDQPEFPTRAITRVLDFPPIPPDILAFGTWLAEYYSAPLTTVFNTMLPSGLGKTRRTTTPAAAKLPGGLPREPLTLEQAAALDILSAKHYSGYLLQGVTGSGKTRVYLEQAARTLAANQSVLMLVPEITLTPQMIQSFAETVHQ